MNDSEIGARESNMLLGLVNLLLHVHIFVAYAGKLEVPTSTHFLKAYKWNKYSCRFRSSLKLKHKN